MTKPANQKSKMARTAERPDRCRRSATTRRPGYVLVVVLGLSVVAFSTGVAFIESQGTVLPEAVNRMAAVRARYMAESGVELAMHYLMYPPTSVNEGDHWQGASEQRIDSTNDYFTVLVQKDASVEGQYTIRCKGVALYYDGDVRGAHSIRATVLVAPSKMINLPTALLAGGDLSLDGALFFGDLHVEGDFVGNAYISGHLSASGSATSTNSSLPPASITENADVVSVPAPNTSSYINYEIDGEPYAALSIAASTITATDAASINALLSAQANNPGRIVYLTKSSVDIESDVDIDGTLVIDGDIRFMGSGSRRITGVDDFPSLVVDGEIRVQNHDSTIELVGPVICSSVDLLNKKNCTFFVNGGLVTTSSSGIKGNGGNNTYLTVQWNEPLSNYHDLTNTGDNRPVTILSWEENY